MSRIIFDNEYVIVIPTFKETVSQKSEELKNWFSHLGKKE